MAKRKQLPCNCGVSKGLRSDHEAECQGAYLRPPVKVQLEETITVSRKAKMVLGRKELIALLEYAGVDLHDKYTLQIEVDGFPHSTGGGWSLEDQGEDSTHILLRWEKPGEEDTRELEVTFGD
jgi:hypothetical protein